MDNLESSTNPAGWITLFTIMIFLISAVKSLIKRFGQALQKQRGPALGENYNHKMISAGRNPMYESMPAETSAMFPSSKRMPRLNQSIFYTNSQPADSLKPHIPNPANEDHEMTLEDFMNMYK